jgi:hypothetical protein
MGEVKYFGSNNNNNTVVTIIIRSQKMSDELSSQTTMLLERHFCIQRDIAPVIVQRQYSYMQPTRTSASSFFCGNLCG